MSRLAERVGLLAADAARPALRSGPLLLRGNVQIALAICRTGGFVHTPRTPRNKKGLENRPFLFWRRGWDSNPRRRR